MKTWFKHVGLFLVLVAVTGAVILVSGIVPIKASSGHWPITHWLLQFAKERSVATHSIGIKFDGDLNDSRLIALGAGAYQNSCFMCHGSPGYPNPVVPNSATPSAPFLPERLHAYSPGELFYIIKHGIKFTGMPAWPALERDDEIWAVVAFVRQFPKLSRADYDELVWGPSGKRELEGAVDQVGASPSIRSELLSCIRCHGSDGQSRVGELVPILAGQSETYLLNSLEAYASGKRHSGIMQPVVAPLEREAMVTLARYFANLPHPPATPGSGTPEEIELGRQLAINGDLQRLIPSCLDCHDPEGVERKPDYPMISGQNQEYILRQLRLFQGGHRGGTDYQHLMHRVAGGMTEEQMKAVAAYFAALPGEANQ